MSNTNIFECSVLGSTPEERKGKLSSASDQQLLELRQYLLQSLSNNSQNKDHYAQYQNVLINEVEPELSRRQVDFYHRVGILRDGPKN
jgi:hypothetical protein